MVNPQRPDDHEHVEAPEPDVEGHIADGVAPTDADPAEDTEGHMALHQPPADGDDQDTEAHGFM